MNFTLTSYDCEMCTHYCISSNNLIILTEYILLVTLLLKWDFVRLLLVMEYFYIVIFLLLLMYFLLCCRGKKRHLTRVTSWLSGSTSKSSNVIIEVLCAKIFCLCVMSFFFVLFPQPQPPQARTSPSEL